MSSVSAAPTNRRSLIRKFRYATLFQTTLVVALAVGAFMPTLSNLSGTAHQHRQQAKNEVIDSGVNNMARLLAMELSAAALPELWDALDRLEYLEDAGRDDPELFAARLRADRLARQLSQNVEEKISYNGVLVDMVVAMPHVHGGDPAEVYVFPSENRRLPQMGLDEITRLSAIAQLTRLTPREGDALEDDAPLTAGLARAAALPATSVNDDSILARYLRDRAGELNGQAYLMPVRREGVPYGYLGLVVKTELISEEVEKTWSQFRVGLEQSLVWLGALSLIALAGGAVFISVLAGRLIQPLEGMRAALRGVPADATAGVDPVALRAASARLAEIPADPQDEIGALRTAFIDLADGLADTLTQKADALARLRESTLQLQRADRLKLVGTLSYGLAHNLNNALAPIANLAHAAQLRHQDDDKLCEMMQSTLEALTRSTAITNRLRDLTRVGSGHTVPVQVNQVLDEALESVRRDLTVAGIRLETSWGDVPEIEGNPVELWQVFTNLLVNAREALARSATRPDRVITVRSSAADGAVRVDIEDNGPGMPAEVRARALDAWFSTKPKGQASGIGLWISSRIVAEHHGTLELDSAEGRGTRITILLRGVGGDVQPQAKQGSHT